MKLPGPWAEGYVLERQHTLSSEFLGHDSFGNPQFETKRSQLGELVFRLKNRSDISTLVPIAETVVEFIKGREGLPPFMFWNPPFDVIVPVPPSRKRLVLDETLTTYVTFLPVVEIATAIGTRLGKPVDISAVKKTKDTPELKNVFEGPQRLKLLEGAFNVDRDAVADKRILLVDDLYRSGATATVVTQELLAAGAKAVYLLAMTKTRTRT